MLKSSSTRMFAAIAGAATGDAGHRRRDDRAGRPGRRRRFDDVDGPPAP